MSRKRQDQVLDEWGDLLNEVRKTRAELPGIAPFMTKLEGAHTRARTAKSLRDPHQARAREETRKLHAALDEGQEAAISLRSYIKSVLGTRTEKLCRYGMKPRPKRVR